jgi:hypothetical protein
MSSFSQANAPEVEARREKRSKRFENPEYNPTTGFSETFRELTKADDAEGWTQESTEDYFRYPIQYGMDIGNLPKYTKFGESIDDVEGIVTAPSTVGEAPYRDRRLIEDGRESGRIDKNEFVEANLLDNFAHQQLVFHADMLDRIGNGDILYKTEIQTQRALKERKFLRDELKDFVKQEIGRMTGPKLFWKDMKSKNRRELTGKGYKRRRLAKNRGDIKTEADRIRKHLSKVKGGNTASNYLSPSTTPTTPNTTKVSTRGIIYPWPSLSGFNQALKLEREQANIEAYKSQSPDNHSGLQNGNILGQIKKGIW